jgi:AraC-like DNA-binding protein
MTDERAPKHHDSDHGESAAALVRALDVGCGILVPQRHSSLGAVFYYEFDVTRGRARVEGKLFAYDCAVITTRGRWQLHGSTGSASVDASTVVLGLAGERYGCAHDARAGDGNYVVCLMPHALDDGAPLFERQLVPAGQAVRLIERALHAPSQDAFDSLIFHCLDEASLLSTSRPQARSRLRGLRAKRLIERHAFERVRIADLAAEVGVSPFTFFRQFKHDAGTTPLAYISELRLERAKRLLLSSKLPVEVIAQRVGFDDAAYFSRFFRRNTGRPPTSFRADSIAG